ncbi:MAG: phosphoribosylformylglycinamidine synthase subunit PurS, partial [Planctomycetaceae bacterium]
MLWEIEIQPRPEGLDREAQGVLSQCRALGLASIRKIRSARSFLVEGAIDQRAAERMGRELLADPVVETL